MYTAIHAEYVKGQFLVLKCGSYGFFFRYVDDTYSNVFNWQVKNLS